jgi:hypothetical protein
MLAVKNSTNRRDARSPAAAMTTGKLGFCLTLQKGSIQNPDAIFSMVHRELPSPFCMH